MPKTSVSHRKSASASLEVHAERSKKKIRALKAEMALLKANAVEEASAAKRNMRMLRRALAAATREAAASALKAADLKGARNTLHFLFHCVGRELVTLGAPADSDLARLSLVYASKFRFTPCEECARAEEHEYHRSHGWLQECFSRLKTTLIST